MSQSADLFQAGAIAGRPLADRMRPRSLAEFSGQQHIVGTGKPLQRAIESDHLHSMASNISSAQASRCSGQSSPTTSTR
ncbi:hypothetical protein [endosymbiont of Ridgeia piscesae]|uniref:Uncharacterized protein n=1 Tax=endosymbiont of Ridgeia piscesae TaxID=54398 RepID=A0A0T5Z3J8_9GAMM|nr:hypothetical protein [endosymbiont of Ridgeia piscesae]KRT57325.1 hypothetical protein Ga0076813_113316 [endosymbiont of Ridgeia piscesae]